MSLCSPPCRANPRGAVQGASRGRASPHLLPDGSSSVSWGRHLAVVSGGHCRRDSEAEALAALNDDTHPLRSAAGLPGSARTRRLSPAPALGDFSAIRRSSAPGRPGFVPYDAALVCGGGAIGSAVRADKALRGAGGTCGHAGWRGVLLASSVGCPRPHRPPGPTGDRGAGGAVGPRVKRTVFHTHRGK